MLKRSRGLKALEAKEKELDPDALQDLQKIKKTFTYRISKWADANPNAEINLWYDSALVTQKALENTLKMMTEISKSRKVNLQLRDIRQLPNLKGKIENIFHPGTPVYYRVDLLKALIGDHILSSPNENVKYCVVTDIDVEPMNSNQLFDQRTINYLSNPGYVFNRVGFCGNFENRFFIFNKENKELQKIHNEVVIIGDSHIPYTRNGRSFEEYGRSEGQIKELINWKAEPLQIMG